MTDADRLLATRFKATVGGEGSGDWNDVLRRWQPRRAKNRRALAVAVAAVAVLAPATFAFGGVLRDLFFGTPAPPTIKSTFSGHNEMARQMREWAKVHGVPAPDFPQVDASKAHGVIAVKTSDGLLFLWAAPAGGTRECWFINFASDQVNRKRALGGGSCDPATPPSRTQINWSYGGSAAHPTLEVLSGRLYVPATTVLVETPNKKPARVPVVGRYFLAAFPRSTKIPTKITALDEHGQAVASAKR